MVENTSGMLATGYRVLIKPDAVDNMTSGGLIKPDEVHEREQHGAMTGVIVDIAPFAFNYEDGWPSERKPELGDRVIFKRYAGGALVEGADGVDYRYAEDKEIVGIFRATDGGF